MTFLDANHCPGAAMILFEPIGRPPVLHTGDFRRAHSADAPVHATLEQLCCVGGIHQDDSR